MRNNKIVLFEYAISNLMEWYRQVVPNWEKSIYSHFSRLASLKLLFLLSAAKDNLNDNKDLLDIFDNYCAMQYGPVEIDVYSAIVYKETKYFNFGNHTLTIETPPTNFSELTNIEKNGIDRAIELVRNYNSGLITLRSSQLVDITHKWDAWQNAIGIAEWYGKGSEKMTTESIRNSRPFYE